MERHPPSKRDYKGSSPFGASNPGPLEPSAGEAQEHLCYGTPRAYGECTVGPVSSLLNCLIGFESLTLRHLKEGTLLEQGAVLKTAQRGSNPRPSATPLNEVGGFM